MVQLTIQQRVFVVTTFHETRSYQRTQEAFRLNYPDRDAPSKSTIFDNVRKYEQEGTSKNCNTGHSGRPRSGRSAANMEAVRQRLADHPRTTSARRNGLGLPKSTFNRITKSDLRMHPYRIHVRHQLTPPDFGRRENFSRWLLERCAADEQFLRFLVVGDEAGFTLNGTVNTRNVIQYAPAGHPPPFNYDLNMSRAKVTVWLGLCGNGRVIGPVIFERNITGLMYLQMLNDIVAPELERHFERQPGGIFRRLFWVQDGAPAHRLQAVRQRLAEMFGDRVISLHHEVEWPARSPDLTPCDYFLWGYLKGKVYSTPPEDIAQLRARIEAEVAVLRDDPGLVRRAMQDMRRRCNLCVERGGGHVEGVGP